MHRILHTLLSLLALTLLLTSVPAAPVPTDITSSVSQLSSPIQIDKFSPPKNLFDIHSAVHTRDPDIFAISDSLKRLGAIAARDDPARGGNNADNARKTGDTLRKGSVRIRRYGHEHDEDVTPYRGWDRDSIPARSPVGGWRRHLSGLELGRVGLKRKRDEGRAMSADDWKAVFSKMAESYKQNGGDATEHVGDIRKGKLPGSLTVSKRNVEEMDSFRDEDWRITLAKMKEAYRNYGGEATEHVGDIRTGDLPCSVVVDKRGTAGTNSFSPEEWKAILSKMISAYKDNHGDVSRFRGESRKGDLPGSVNTKRDVTIYPGFNEESIPAASPLDKLIGTLSPAEKKRLGLSERGDGDTFAALAAWKARVIASQHTPPDKRDIVANDEGVDELASVLDNVESAFSKHQGDGVKDLHDKRDTTSPAWHSYTASEFTTSILPKLKDEFVAQQGNNTAHTGDAIFGTVRPARHQGSVPSTHEKRDTAHPHHHYNEAEFIDRVLPTLKTDFFASHPGSVSSTHERRDAAHPHHHYNEAEFLDHVLPAMKAGFFASHPGAAPFGRRDAEVGDGVDCYLPEWWGNKPDGVDQTAD
jgi:hypothetical protein